MRVAAPAATLVAALLLAAPAGAVLILQKGMAGIRLGMTQSKVRAKLGKPASVAHGSNDFGNYTELRYSGLRVTFQGNATVTASWTNRRRQRTAPGGARVGRPPSQDARLRADPRPQLERPVGELGREHEAGRLERRPDVEGVRAEEERCAVRAAEEEDGDGYRRRLGEHERACQEE